MGELAEAGCVAFSQADRPLADVQVLLRACSTPGRSVTACGCGRRTRTCRERRGARRRGGDAPRPAGDPGDRETVALATILVSSARRGYVCTCAGCRRPTAWRWFAPRRPRACRSPRMSASTTCTLRRRHRWFDPLANFVPPLRATRDRDALRAGSRTARSTRSARPRAGRRRREAGALRRGRPGRRARAVASPHAEVGIRGARAARAALARVTSLPPRSSVSMPARSGSVRRPTSSCSMRAAPGASSAARWQARARTRRSSAWSSRGACARRSSRRGRPRVRVSAAGRPKALIARSTKCGGGPASNRRAARGRISSEARQRGGLTSKRPGTRSALPLSFVRTAPAPKPRVNLNPQQGEPVNDVVKPNCAAARGSPQR